MAFSIKKVGAALLNIAYPPLCAHCQERLSQRGPQFCPACLEQLSLIETQDRCRTCFAELSKGGCERCKKRPIVIHRQMAACEALGPAKSLLHALENGRKECFSAAASLMAYQWLQQKMPLPHFLIPFPVSFWHKQKHGFDVNLQLATELSKIFSVPMYKAFTRKFDRSHLLSQGEIHFRLHLSKAHLLCDQHLLLVAPLLDDELFRSAGNELRACFPLRLDALAFAVH